MRPMLVMLGMALLAVPASAQTTLRRPQQKGFPLAVTPSAGFAFGGTRARFFDPDECTSAESCYVYSTGSGWQVGLELQVPLGQVLGFEVAGQLGRPSIKQCLHAQCATVDRLWAVRGTGTLLFRFKPRAPVYFGLGAAYTYFNPGPIFVYQDGIAVSELGATTVVGLDLALDERLGGRIVWRGYLLVPSSKGIPDPDVLTSMAWDNAVSIGLRFLLGR